jgi:predicted amidohydrolase
MTGDGKIKIAMLKAFPAKWDVVGNWAIFEKQFETHAKGVDVFVTPECFLDGYAVTEKDWTVDRFATVAQHVSDSVYIHRVCEMAKTARVNVVFGFTEMRGGYFFNAALLINRKGERVGTYYKTHLQTHDVRFARGEDIPVFDLDFGRVGVVICADRRWPESIRTLRLKGAKICLMPTYGMSHEKNEWWMRTRSYENQMFVCFAHPGVALITDPKGDVAAKLQSNVPDVLVHDVDLSEASDGNHLSDRRPELYGVIAEVDHWSRQLNFDSPRVEGH